MYVSEVVLINIACIIYLLCIFFLPLILVRGVIIHMLRVYNSK